MLDFKNFKFIFYMIINYHILVSLIWFEFILHRVPRGQTSGEAWIATTEPSSPPPSGSESPAQALLLPVLYARLFIQYANKIYYFPFQFQNNKKKKKINNQILHHFKVTSIESDISNWSAKVQIYFWHSIPWLFLDDYVFCLCVVSTIYKPDYGRLNFGFS